MTRWSATENARVSGDPLILDAWENWAGAIDCGHTGRLWRAAELQRLSSAMASRPAFRDLPSGTPVIVMLANTVAFPVTLMALLRRRCNPLLVFPGTPMPALLRLAAEFGVRFVVHEFVEGITALDPNEAIHIDRVEIGSIAVALLGTGVDAEPMVAIPGEGVLLHPTSGTYGKARFCLRNQTKAMAEAASYIGTFEFYRRIRVAFATPLSHGYGYGFGMLASFLTDSTLAIDSAFNPKRVLRREQEQPSDILALVPPMVKALLGVAGPRPDRIGAATFYSGAPIDPQLAQSFERAFGTPLYTNWGTTETGPITTSFSGSGRLAGVGRPFSGVSVETIGRDALSGLGAGVGELQVASPALMQGYVPGVDPLHPIGKFATGDIGSIDIDGCVHLVGRIRDIVNVGGNKVDPAEIEAVLLSYRGVDDVAVYPGLREDGTEFVQAALVGHELDTVSLRAYCLEQLDAHKLPAVFHQVDAIPRTPSGKAMKVKCPGYPDRLDIGARRP
jgi:acyl-CoA synthetase (AMP-forming)/AMP-acid ligase II